MALPTASDNPFPSLLVTEGTAPSSPASGKQRVYIDSSDHLLKVKNSSGTVTTVGSGVGGSVATDAIWDAAGDLAVGTGADTAAKLTLGASGKAPISNGSTLVYVYPPGYEFDYAEKTTSTSVTATAEGSADVVVTGNAVTYDGSTAVWLEFFAVAIHPDAAAGSSISVIFYDSVGTSSIGRVAFAQASGASGLFTPCIARRKVTPTNAAHTYSVRAYLAGAGTGSVPAGVGGSGANDPCFIRITKA